MLYMPCAGEIENALQSIVHLLPCAKRAERAIQILENGHIRDGDGIKWQIINWQVKSQDQEKDGWYYVGSGNMCQCADYRLNGWTWCKHRIAFVCYGKILTMHLNKRIASLQAEKVRGEFLLAGCGMGVCVVNPVGEMWKFRDERSMSVFGHWLYAREMKERERESYVLLNDPHALYCFKAG